MKSVLGIFRSACFSPGMVDRDEAILRSVVTRLEKSGYAVSTIHEDHMTFDTPIPDIVLHMTRSSHALDILQSWEKRGCRVINSVEGVRSAERAALAKFCAAHNIPTPKTWIVDVANNGTLVVETTEGICEEITFPCWVKRAGSCAQQSDDVCRVDDKESYVECLANFNARNIHQVVVMQHIEGVCIKFYVVRGAGFFYWLPAEKLEYEKFLKSNLPKKQNAAEDNWEFNTKMDTVSSALKTLTQSLGVSGETYIRSMSRTSSPLLEVFGGDAIIDDDGIACLIDLNDWPSFSACREEAADAIFCLVDDCEKENGGM